MFIDQKLIFSDGQDLTTTAVSTNVIDFGVARDPGAGEPLWLFFQFGDIASNATWNYALKGADDEGISSNVITKLDLNAAITPTDYTQYAVRVPPGVPKRYWRIDYTVSGGSTPHIYVFAAFVKDVEVKIHGSRSYY